MERKLTYFLSDLHLGARYFIDPKEQERLVCAWLRSIAPTARRIYLVGDVLDYWYEYRHVVPRGFVRFFGTLAELADSGIEITWLIGNHDIWIFDYLPEELGVRVVDGVIEEEIDGKRFVLAHGDGLGPVPSGERLMRAIFRSRFLQKLYAALHPRWTVGFAYWWSGQNRIRHHTGTGAQPASPEPLYRWVRDRNAALPANKRPDYYIFGHYHLVAFRQIAGSAVAIIGDWLTNMSYATFDGTTFDIGRHEHAAVMPARINIQQK